MRKKLILYMLLLAMITMLSMALLVLPRLYGAFEQQMYAVLRSTAGAIASALEQGVASPEALEQSGTRLSTLRVTWIDARGDVRYDSNLAADALDNHADREEIQEAFAVGEGKGTRLSTTLGERTYYYAVRLSDGSVLRLSQSQRSVYAEVMGLLPFFVLILLAVLGLAAIVASRLTDRLVEPLNKLDLEHPADNDVYEELSPLLLRLAEQNRRIEQQMRTAAEEAEALAAITDNMAEGLVVLSAQGTILSINQSARRLFGEHSGRRVGEHYITLNRNLEMHHAVEQAIAGDTARARLMLGGRTHQLLASPVHAGGKVDGAVLLLLDVTEQEMAEASRREFSANVSHELKTPLTTIAGYAEMMRAGMVAPEDVVPLSEKIYAEARRLMALIEDIIALSKLDEGKVPSQGERVDLHALAEETAAILMPLAAQREVTLTVRGETAVVVGSRPVLLEMVSNLMDNAIKYNRTGGQVTVTAAMEAGEAVLTVQDTGVGIAPEHQERVFERFYRVDKSHSRETGGTGLGLSIVKHGALTQHATVALESVEGEGTTIRLHFPRKE